MANRSEAIPTSFAETRTHSVDLRHRVRWGERVITALLFICGAVSILTTVGIVYELGKESAAFFTRALWENTNKPLADAIDAEQTVFQVGTQGAAIAPGDTIRISDEEMLVESVEGTLVTVQRAVNDTAAVAHPANLSIEHGDEVTLLEFFSNTKWIPQIGEFGILPLINATLMTSLVAMLVALPLGLMIAIYLSEYAAPKVRGVLKPVLEVLAGIPTVVYGYFALTFMTPLLRLIFGQDTVDIYNTASAGIVIGILVIPLVSSMSEDALNAVPNALRHAAYGLGATRLETAVRVVLPAAISGIAAAFIVAISRAVGETMIVALAAGAGPNFTFNPFKGAETMTGHIVRISGGDLSYDSIDYNSIFAIGLVLFFMTLTLNIVSQAIVRRFREVYE